MRVFSHTCSNTEIVCALGCAAMLVGVDKDSDWPPEVVAPLPKPGRDLDLDADAVRALKPDLVLTSLTVPGHERVVAALEADGLKTLVCDPTSLADVYGDIQRIAEELGVSERGRELVASMERAMPAVEPRGKRPAVLVEWWPKPVIAPGRQSWVTDLIWRAGGRNPWGEEAVKSRPVTTGQVCAAAPDAVVMSWCGVKVEKYRASLVRAREGWEQIPALVASRIYPISEQFMGRPGPRLVEGYRALREIIAAIES
jgi:iron complex transport system substrate-binding protein